MDTPSDGDRLDIEVLDAVAGLFARVQVGATDGSAVTVPILVQP